MQTPEEYVKTGGKQCPACGSSNLDCEEPAKDEVVITQGCYCMACDCMWVDVYELATYVELNWLA